MIDNFLFHACLETFPSHLSLNVSRKSDLVPLAASASTIYRAFGSRVQRSGGKSSTRTCPWHPNRPVALNWNLWRCTVGCFHPAPCESHCNSETIWHWKEKFFFKKISLMSLYKGGKNDTLKELTSTWTGNPNFKVRTKSLGIKWGLSKNPSIQRCMRLATITLLISSVAYFFFFINFAKGCSSGSVQCWTAILLTSSRHKSLMEVFKVWNFYIPSRSILKCLRQKQQYKNTPYTPSAPPITEKRSSEVINHFKSRKLSWWWFHSEPRLK